MQIKKKVKKKRNRNTISKYCRFYPSCREKPTHRVLYHVYDDPTPRKSYYCDGHADEVMVMKSSGEDTTQYIGHSVDKIERIRGR